MKEQIKDIGCPHLFTMTNKDNKPICEKCSMEAELFFERKFESIEDFIKFNIGRILGINIKDIGTKP